MPNETTGTPRVFISHTTHDPRDRELARRLAEGLEERGLRAWAAPHSIPPGTDWKQQLSLAIDRCSHFLVIWSAAAATSEWVLYEIDAARSRQERGEEFPVLPLVLGTEHHPFLAERQRLPYHHDIRAQLDAVVAALGRRIDPVTLIPIHAEPFVGRENVFAAAADFRDDVESGYFAVVGDPGEGKTALCAEFVRRTRCVAHFVSRAGGVDHAGQCVANIHDQLVAQLDLRLPPPPSEASDLGPHWMRLLKGARAATPTGTALIVAIDAVDEVDRSDHGEGANPLFLPPTLPPGVHFFLTYRDGMAPPNAAPFRVFDLAEHKERSHEDIEEYIRGSIDRLRLRPWIAARRMEAADFVTVLSKRSRYNFMYLHHVLPEIAGGAYRAVGPDDLPVALRGYYEDHWRRMGMRAKPVPRDRIRIISVLAELARPVSRSFLGDVLDEDPVTVQDVLDEWSSFLHRTEVAGEVRYSAYHSSFLEFLRERDLVRAAGDPAKGTPSLMADRVLAELYADAADPRPRLPELTPEQRDYVRLDLVRHLAAARRFGRLEALLTDVEFLAQRCASDGVFGVLRDVETAGSAAGARWPPDAVPRRFGQFLARAAHLLAVDPTLLWQEAVNTPDPVVASRAAAAVHHAPTRPWLRRLSTAPRDRHGGRIVSLTFWTDRYVAASTAGMELWVWDLSTGRIHRRCDAPISPAKSLTVSPDGRRLAAAVGSSFPMPSAAAVLVWSRSGRLVSRTDPGDWVYTVRWRDDAEIVAAGGVPLGSDAVGRLWRVDVADETATVATTAVAVEFGTWLADRPILLTWDPDPDDRDQVMALVHDGTILHLTRGYEWISSDEAWSLSSQLMSDGDWDAHDERMGRRRPVIGSTAAPTADPDGLATTAVRLDDHRIALLGEPPVTPEEVFWHRPVPDGVYLVDLVEQTYHVLHPLRPAIEAAICLAAAPDGRTLALGTARGAVYRLDVEGDEAPRLVHRGDAAVTALGFGPGARHLAVGDAGGRLVVHDLARGEAVFDTGVPDPAVVAAVVEDDRPVVLVADRLRTDAGEVLWPEDLTALGVDCCGTLAVVLTRDWRDGTQQLLEVDLGSRRVIRTFAVPAPGTADAEPERLVLRSGDDGPVLHLGSSTGVAVLHSLEPGVVRSYALSAEDSRREHDITVVDLYGPTGLTCGIFTVLPGTADLLCAYTDNGALRPVPGELHRFDARTGGSLRVADLASAVSALVAIGGLAVAATVLGEVTAFAVEPGGLRRLATTTHPVRVACLAVDEHRHRVCSVSDDGLLAVWDAFDGREVLRTDVVSMPAAVAFVAGGTRLVIVDSGGQPHTWRLENW